MPKVKLEVPGQAKLVTADYQIEDSTFSLVLNGYSDDPQMYQGTWVATGPGEGWLSCDGKILPFFLTQNEEKLNIWLDGNTYALNLESAEARRAGKAGANTLLGGDVKAPMPGTVLKVLVKAGDQVEANQPLVIMESMKMEMTLSAPAAALVQDVFCSEGKLVDMGTHLVKLELTSQ